MDSPTVLVVITRYIPHYIMHNISTFIFYNHGQVLQMSWIAAHLAAFMSHFTAINVFFLQVKAVWSWQSQELVIPWF